MGRVLDWLVADGLGLDKLAAAGDPPSGVRPRPMTRAQQRALDAERTSYDADKDVPNAPNVSWANTPVPSANPALAAGRIDTRFTDGEGRTFPGGMTDRDWAAGRTSPYVSDRRPARATTPLVDRLRQRASVAAGGPPSPQAPPTGGPAEAPVGGRLWGNTAPVARAPNQGVRPDAASSRFPGAAPARPTGVIEQAVGAGSPFRGMAAVGDALTAPLQYAAGAARSVAAAPAAARPPPASAAPVQPARPAAAAPAVPPNQAVPAGQTVFAKRGQGYLQIAKQLGMPIGTAKDRAASLAELRSQVAGAPGARHGSMLMPGAEFRRPVQAQALPAGQAGPPAVAPAGAPTYAGVNKQELAKMYRPKPVQQQQPAAPAQAPAPAPVAPAPAPRPAAVAPAPQMGAHLRANQPGGDQNTPGRWATSSGVNAPVRPPAPQAGTSAPAGVPGAPRAATPRAAPTAAVKPPALGIPAAPVPAPPKAGIR